MVKLAKPILICLVNEFGTKEVVRRFSDPCWFQSLACALGFEYNYTGATTVTLKAIKEALSNENIGVTIAGGKGKESRKTPHEILNYGDKCNLSDTKISSLTYASKMSGKIDQVALQDSFDIYFHTMVLGEKGDFSVINQGMNVQEMLVRRYHWLNTSNFIEEPHAAISGKEMRVALDLTSKKSGKARKTIVDIVHDESPDKLQKKLLLLGQSDRQKRLIDFFKGGEVIRLPYYLNFPRRLNQEALRIAKEAQNFEEVLGAKGMGPATMRGLAFISSLIYGSEVSWNDPKLYCYAFGTKAGKPWMVEKNEMADSADVLTDAIKQAKLGNSEKMRALRRLSRVVI